MPSWRSVNPIGKTADVHGVSPHMAPVDAMIAQDFTSRRGPCARRVLATESIVVTMVEGAWPRLDVHGARRVKDQRGRIQRTL